MTMDKFGLHWSTRRTHWRLDLKLWRVGHEIFWFRIVSFHYSLRALAKHTRLELWARLDYLIVSFGSLKRPWRQWFFIHPHLSVNIFHKDLRCTLKWLMQMRFSSSFWWTFVTFSFRAHDDWNESLASWWPYLASIGSASKHFWWPAFGLISHHAFLKLIRILFRRLAHFWYAYR